MTAEKLNRFWLLATGVLVLIIIAGSCIIWVRHDNGQPLTVSLPTTSPFSGQVYVDGAVANPGTYPLKTGDSLDILIQASGGLNNDADLSQIRLYIPSPGSNPDSQKIDINHAEAWLLLALPGIGDVRAKAIIDYRQQSGLFNNIEELTSVPGITSAIFEKIKPFIMVGD
jgi:competence protein ComEA